MKKILFAAAGLLLVVVACQVQDEQNATNSETKKEMVQRVGTSELSDAILVSKTTDSLTQGIINMGVNRITAVESLTDIKYEVRTGKHFNLNSYDTDYSSYKFTFDGKKLSIDGVSGYSVSMFDGVLFLDCPQYSGAMDKISDKVELDNDAIILLHFTEEITTPSTSKALYSSAGGGGCSFWDTYYYYGVGLSSSTSQANLNNAISHYGTSGCAPIGGVDTSCFLTSHICISTKAYCCP